jgi:hypothetical protein
MYVGEVAFPLRGSIIEGVASLPRSTSNMLLFYLGEAAYSLCRSSRNGTSGGT